MQLLEIRGAWADGASPALGQDGPGGNRHRGPIVGNAGYVDEAPSCARVSASGGSHCVCCTLVAARALRLGRGGGAQVEIAAGIPGASHDRERLPRETAQVCERERQLGMSQAVRKADL